MKELTRSMYETILAQYFDLENHLTLDEENIFGHDLSHFADLYRGDGQSNPDRELFQINSSTALCYNFFLLLARQNEIYDLEFEVQVGRPLKDQIGRSANLDCAYLDADKCQHYVESKYLEMLGANSVGSFSSRYFDPDCYDPATPAIDAWINLAKSIDAATQAGSLCCFNAPQMFKHLLAIVKMQAKTGKRTIKTKLISINWSVLDLTFPLPFSSARAAQHEREADYWTAILNQFLAQINVTNITVEHHRYGAWRSRLDETGRKWINARYFDVNCKTKYQRQRLNDDDLVVAKITRAAALEMFDDEMISQQIFHLGALCGRWVGYHVQKQLTAGELAPRNQAEALVLILHQALQEVKTHCQKNIPLDLIFINHLLPVSAETIFNLNSWLVRHLPYLTTFDAVVYSYLELYSAAAPCADLLTLIFLIYGLVYAGYPPLLLRAEFKSLYQKALNQYLEHNDPELVLALLKSRAKA